MKIVLTGGTGFIGSHIAVELLNNDNTVFIIDNLSNSTYEVIDNIKQITDKGNLIFCESDITQPTKECIDIFKTHQIDCVVHLAASKAVGESVLNPLKYYQNNVGGLVSILQLMKKYHVNNIVFSSSATVYGNPESLLLTEKSKLNAINPYGQTKLIGEQILKDVAVSNSEFKAISLRYFNPVGAHPSGLIGESPLGVPNNLFPYVLDVVRGKRDYLTIYGNDYNTPDGTGIRDYIHVVDLAKGHVAALNKIHLINGIKTYNLGTGKGYSVLEIVDTFNQILDRKGDTRKIRFKFGPRRDGDSAAIYADCSLAKQELEWSSINGLEQMITDSLNFIDQSEL
jgi:UDP-glucose 4-epimerase